LKINFYKIPNIKTSSSEDYKNNIWDHGHMFPVIHSKCDTVLLRESYSYANCALQHQSLNRGVWRVLEGQEYLLSKTGTVKVIIKVHFINSKRVRGGASIPSGFTKYIYLDNKLFKTYYFPNEKITKSLKDYEV
jgi:DNA/RNA endonuclease G (NUC1)